VVAHQLARTDERQSNQNSRRQHTAAIAGVRPRAHRAQGVNRALLVVYTHVCISKLTA